jgi:hypothetical protein
VCACKNRSFFISFEKLNIIDWVGLRMYKKHTKMGTHICIIYMRMPVCKESCDHFKLVIKTTGKEPVIFVF